MPARHQDRHDDREDARRGQAQRGVGSEEDAAEHRPGRTGEDRQRD
jgi:hypothetical protein